MSILRSPISWPGGKARLAPQLVPMLPPHRLYVEPFGGGAGMLLNKPRSRSEVYNDINGDLVRFFRCVRFHIHEFIREIELIPNSRLEFEDFLKQPGLTDIQRAARWYVCNKISFGGMGEHYGTGRQSGGAAFASRFARIDLLQAINERFDSVNVEHLDAVECIKKYDVADGCFFVDPPYINGFAYGRLFSRDAHRDIRDALMDSKASWVVTYDDDKFVRELYKGCRFKKISGQLGIGNMHANKRAVLKQLVITPSGKK